MFDEIVVETTDGKKYTYDHYVDYFIQDGLLKVYREKERIRWGTTHRPFHAYFKMDCVKCITVI